MSPEEEADEHGVQKMFVLRVLESREGRVEWDHWFFIFLGYEDFFFFSFFSS